MTLPDLSDPAIPRLVVTGHPNHELAIFGLVQRLRPRLLFLTDGGGEERVAESRRALATLGLLDHAGFLGWSEASLYQALLARDAAVFAILVAQVRAEIAACLPRQILCESVELYNPLHDVTLPIVRAAIRGRTDIEIVEFPLIAQEPVAAERYRVQRLPRARQGMALRLTAEEHAAKLKAQEEQYLCLRRQLGGILAGLGREHSAVEFFAPAIEGFPTPGREHLLRYEWRGRHLQERGEIERFITYHGHFLPLVSSFA